MQKSYTLNFAKIYIWQILSILLNLGSLFIVIPNISKDKELYGIFSVCISLTIFLSYSDLGFVNAGSKYAAEFYAKQDRAKEKQVIGFSAFILFIFTLLFSSIVGLLAIKPTWLFNALRPDEERVASHLLGILATFAPSIVLQRILQMIYSIRLKDYILQIALVVSNMLKIATVPIFFNANTYNLPGYFLCYQIFSVIALFIAGIIAQKRFKLSFFSLGKDFSFSKEMFLHTKKLAYGSLLITICWILFYELDPYILARITTPSVLSAYIVGLTLLSFYRSIFGALFNPFTARFNHLIGLNDEKSLKKLYSKSIKVMLPVTLFPIVSFSALARPFILAWLGVKFEQSILTSKILILSNIFAFISYPASILLLAKEKLKSLYLTSVTLPVVYYICMLTLYPILGVTGLAISKLFTFFVVGIIYIKFSAEFLGITYTSFVTKYILPAAFPVSLMTIVLGMASPYLEPTTKNLIQLLYIILLSLLGIGIGFLTYYFFSPSFRKYIHAFFGKLIYSLQKH